MKELLKVEHLSVTFSSYRGNVRAVRDVSFTIYEEEILAMAGESGCGKSVTARAVMGLLDRSSAVIDPASSVWYQGQDLLTLKKRQLNRIRGKEIGMIFQDAMASLNPTMTIGKQLTETLRVHLHLGREDRVKRARELLELVELPNPASLLSRYPHELSGGQRQRVMIAMALSCDPRLLIADEPTTALDVTIQAQILSLLKNLQHRLRMSVLLITHDLGIVAGTADRMQVMYGGRIIERGTVCDIYRSPAHPYTAALMQAIPGRSIKRRTPLYTLNGTPPDLQRELNCCSFSERCPYAMPVCRKALPPDTGSAACWLTDQRAPRIDLSADDRRAL